MTETIFENIYLTSFLFFSLVCPICSHGGAGLIVYTAASHQGEVKMILASPLGGVMLSIFIFSLCSHSEN